MWGGEIFNAFDMTTARGMSLLGHDKRAVKIWEAAPEEKCLLLRLRPLTIYRRLSVCPSVCRVCDVGCYYTGNFAVKRNRISRNP